MIYISQGTAVLKATDKQWKACVADQLAWLWTGAPIDPYGDLPIATGRSGKAALVSPDRWTAKEWLDAAYDCGVFKDREKLALIEVADGIFQSADGHLLVCRFKRWYLQDKAGATIGEGQSDIRVLLRKNKLEIYWRFV